MRILFTPAGDTDPVRGYHDGAILHILRHYKIDKVILALTKDMEEKEKTMGCYAKGIESVSPRTPLEYKLTGITEPHLFEPLTMVQDIFEEAYQAYPDAEWLVNISSGTPQLKSHGPFGIGLSTYQSHPGSQPGRPIQSQEPSV